MVNLSKWKLFQTESNLSQYVSVGKSSQTPVRAFFEIAGPVFVLLVLIAYALYSASVANYASALI